ncbi:MAG: hypothetical protein JXB32_00990, partial [Deltaproteobacteria bacterium]|nr:hypothetical protein [Deltaproteobacteria bacterium]
MTERRGWIVVACSCLWAGVGCIPPEPEPPPPGEEFPPPVQPSLRPADNAEVIASWDFRGCKDGWTPASIAGTTWVCGPIVRGPGGDRTGEGDGWGVGMTEPPAGRTESTLTSPEIHLGGSNDAVFTLSVWHWLDGEA